MFEGYADLPNTRLWYWDTGGDGEVVVLLHPASQSCRIWENQRDAFMDAGYRVIAYSRRGHYRSEFGGAEEPGTTVSDLLALIDWLSINRVNLIGAAAGALTAIGFAVAEPARASSMVLAGTIFAPDEEDWRAMFKRLGIAEARGRVATEFLELGPSFRATHPDRVARFAALSQQALADKALNQPIGPRITWRAIEQLAMPVLLLTGEADLFAPPPLQQMMASHLQHCRVETLREVGHAPYWEAPDDFNAVILDFLASSH